MPATLASRSLSVGILLVIGTFAACSNEAPTAPTERAIAVATSATAHATSNGNGPQACAPDTKLIGRVAASTADQPGTWWRLTKDRFDALGVTDYRAALSSFYGQDFPSLQAAIQFLIDGVVAWDANGNGYVCAYEVRGTRAFLGENALYLFGISDDKHFEN